MWLTVILTLMTEERSCQKREATQTHKRVYSCSFCGKAQTEVKTLVAGPGVFICDECVQLCQEIIAKKAATQASTQEVPGSLLPYNAPTETLLKTLAGYNGAFERVDAGMQDIVDILREREVSWAAMEGRSLPCRVRRHGSALGEAKRHPAKRLVCAYLLSSQPCCTRLRTEQS